MQLPPQLKFRRFGRDSIGFDQESSLDSPVDSGVSWYDDAKTIHEALKADFLDRLQG